MTGTYLGQIGLDAARCAVIAVAALVIGWALGARLPRTRWTLALLLAPVLTPALLVSYAYQPLALRLTGEPLGLVAAYSFLLTLKLSTLAALTRWLFPPMVAPEALYCLHLVEDQSWWWRLSFAVRALGSTPGLILAVTFLLAFTDFELASLLSVKCWPVLLFDAHSGGLEIHESLKKALAPLAIELLLVAAMVTAARSVFLAQQNPHNSVASSRWTVSLAALIGLITAAVPFGAVMVQAALALPTVGYTGIMLQEIVTSIAFAIAGAGLAWVVGDLARYVRFGSALILPGLLGGLVVALLVLTVFQFRVLQFAYDTPAPLTLALAMLFAPIALLVSWIVRVNQPGESLHLARMAGSSRLIWDLSLSRKVAAVGLVFLLAYSELSASALLAPTGFTPVFVRLHNLAHYGQTPTLSLMLLAATLAPAVLLALTLGLGRLYARRDAR